MTKTQPQPKPGAASHTYRIEIPNSVDDMDLSPYAFRLYGRIKRRAADNGVCRDGDRDLAAHCKMSQPTVSRAKSQLKKAGLIETRRVKGVDEIRIVDIWQENYDRYAPREASQDRFSQNQSDSHRIKVIPTESNRFSQNQSDSHRIKVIPTESNRFSQNQSDSHRITPPDPLNRIEETVQEPSEKTTQELSLSPRASNAQGAGDEPERERDAAPRYKTKYTLEQVQACARAKGMGDGWVNDALWKGIHDWQIEGHLNPPLPLPPVAVYTPPPVINSPAPPGRDAEADEVWRRALVALRGQIAQESFETWFVSIEAVKFEGERLLLYAPNEVIRDWVQENYRAQIEVALGLKFEWWRPPAVSATDEARGSPSAMAG
jgi:hypothetical protein